MYANPRTRYVDGNVQKYLALCAAGLVACGDNVNRSRPDGSVGDGGPADSAASGWRGVVIGTALGDEVLDLALDGDTLIAAGYRNGVLGQQNLEPSGNATGFVTAYAFDGTVRWDQAFETAGADTVDAVDIGANDIAVVGRTSGAFSGFINGGQVDAYVARFPRGGTNGPELRQFGDARPQHMVRIVRESSGALLVGGYEDTFVEGSAVTAFDNPTLARVRPDFSLDWYRRDESNASADYYFALAPTGIAGEAFVAGGISAGGNDGPFVRRLDAQGGVTWERRIGSVGFDPVTAMVLHTDGKLYAAGASFQVIGDQSYGEQDMFVVVIDPATGVIERAMQAGSAESDFPRDLVIASDGTVYVVGETLGTLPGATLAGEYDLAVVRFAPDGTWTGSWQRGTAGDETANAAVLTGDALYLGGYQYESLVPDASAAGGRDGFVLRVPLGDIAAR